MKKFTALDVCMLGVATASLTAIKFALSWLSNVELVSVLLVWYTLIFKRSRAFLVANLFIIVECFIYGFGLWIMFYVIHWNCLVLLVGILGRRGIRKSIFFALWCTLLTFLFGVQTTALEVIFYSPSASFFPSFLTRYFMGLSFFITHIVSVFVSVFVLLPPLSKIPVTGDRYIVSY